MKRHGFGVLVALLSGAASAQLWQTPQATARQAILKDFAVQGNVLQGPQTRLTLDVSGGRVVGVLVDAPTAAGVARGVGAAWGLKEAGLPALTRQLSAPGVVDGARGGLVQDTDESGQDFIALKVTGQGAQTHWRAYLGLRIWPDSAFGQTRNVSGQPGAPHTIRVFSDFQCPYCKELWDETRPSWEKQGGQYRLMHYHFPLNFHQNAFAAAEASECASAQGAFWKVAGALFADAAGWTRLDPAGAASRFRTYAQGAGLNMAAFDSCVARHTSRPAVQAQLDAGLALGVGGTPTVFLNGLKLQNYTSAEEWARVLAVTGGQPRAGDLIQKRLTEFR